MNNLDKQDLLEMIKNGDKTELVLHWEGDDGAPELGDAASILDCVEDVANDPDYGYVGKEEELWAQAYICTLADYEEEQRAREDR